MQILGLILGATVCVQYLQLLSEYFASLRMNDLVPNKNSHQAGNQYGVNQLTKEKINSKTWQGRRRFVVACRIQETANVVSFHLVPQDRKPLPGFTPGQHLMLGLKFSGQKRTVKRCYSLSASPHRDYYRITVKKVPNGLVSSFLHDEIKVGDTVEAYAPAGNFRIENTSDQPLVLISGGVGVTPFLSVLEEIAANSFRETILINVVRNGEEHIRKSWLDTLSSEHPHIQVYTFYSAPNNSDIQGLDYQAKGRVTLNAIQNIVKSQLFKFYLCGSKEMTQSLYEQLTYWGVADADIQMEGFGGPDFKSANVDLSLQLSKPTDLTQSSITVKFEQSRKTVQWNPAAETILDLAEQNGIKLESVCRSGNCGVCRIGILSGCVEHLPGNSGDPQSKSCLPCTAKPVGDVVLNA